MTRMKHQRGFFLNPFRFGFNPPAPPPAGDIAPEYRSSATSYSATNAAVYPVTLPPDYEAGDLVIVGIVHSANSGYPLTPAGWDLYGAPIAFYGNTLQGYAIMHSRVMDGTEGATVQYAKGAATDSSFAATAVCIKKNTFTYPRGTYAGTPILTNTNWPLAGLGQVNTLPGSVSAPATHVPWYPYWGGSNTLYMSWLVRVADAAYLAAPYNDFSVAPATARAVHVSGSVILGTPDLPILPAAYVKAINNSAGSATVNAAIPGISSKIRPECIHLHDFGTTGTAVASINASPYNGHTKLMVADLQITVILLPENNGAVVITPPAGYELLAETASLGRARAFKRVITDPNLGVESWGFSPATSFRVRSYVFPAGKYDPSTDIAVRYGQSTTALVAVPAYGTIMSDATWDGKQNYALRFVIRGGNAGLGTARIASFPPNDLEQRNDGRTNVGATGLVSWTSAGGIEESRNAALTEFVFQSGSSWGSLTLFVKGPPRVGDTRGAFWTQRNWPLPAATPVSVACNAGTWVAVGAAGSLATAVDPTAPWTVRTSSFGATFVRDVAYGGGMWVAVGDGGKIATATDPTSTWTQRASPFGTSLVWRVTYGNGIWVATTFDGEVATATDPTGTWTLQSVGFAGAGVMGVTYADGLWVVVGVGGRIATAMDPTGTWTLRDAGFGTTDIRCVAYGGGLWAISGANGMIATATDPTGAWTQRDSGFGASIVYHVAFGNGIWVATSDAGRIATAADPAGTWTQQKTKFPASSIVLYATYNGGDWVAVSSQALIASSSE